MQWSKQKLCSKERRFQHYSRSKEGKKWIHTPLFKYEMVDLKQEKIGRILLPDISHSLFDIQN